jgi:hypothetical protein
MWKRFCGPICPKCSERAGQQRRCRPPCLRCCDGPSWPGWFGCPRRDPPARTRRVAEHVRMNLEWQPSGLAEPFYEFLRAVDRQRGLPLAHKHVARVATPSENHQLAAAVANVGRPGRRRTPVKLSTPLLRWTTCRSAYVNLGGLIMGPFHRVLGRHALDRLGIHVRDDVFGHHFGGLAIGRPGISCQPAR